MPFAPRKETIRVHGYREFLQAVAAMPPEIRKDVRGALREAGEQVRKDSASKTKTELNSTRSAVGYRTFVRARGVSVEQTLRKTTGLRPDWGKSQMRKSLVPALEENEPETLRLMERAAQDIADYFELVARWRSLGFIP